MKRTIPLLLALVMGLFATQARAQQEIYERYSVRENLHVAYVEDLQLRKAKGTFIILEPQDRQTWFALIEEFDFPKEAGRRPAPGVIMAYSGSARDKQDPARRAPMKKVLGGKEIVDWDKSCNVLVNPLTRKIYIIYADSGKELWYLWKRVVDTFKPEDERDYEQSLWEEGAPRKP